MNTKTVTTVEEVDIEETDKKEVLENENDTLSELNALLDELGGEDKPEISVYHQSAGGKSAMEFCFQYEPGELTVADALTRLREQFGSGTFRFHVRGGNPRRLIANKAFSLAPLIEKPEKENGASNMMEMMQMQMAQQQTMFNAINGAMVSMMTAQSENRPAPVDPAAQQKMMLEQMALMKEIFGSNNKGSEIDTLLQGMELAGNLGPKGDTNSSDLLLKAMETFAGPVAQIMANESSPALPPQQIDPNQLAPGTTADAAPAATQQLPPPEQENNQMRAIIKQQLKFLLTGAENNSDPASYADIVVDNVGLERLGQICAQQPLLAWVYDYLPESKNYPDWFEELETAIMEMIDPSTKEEGTEEVVEIEADPLTAEVPGDIVPDYVSNQTAEPAG